MAHYTLQSLFLPHKEGINYTESLYFVGEADMVEKELFITNGKISFGTYFNVFSIFKWKKYTGIKDLYIRIKAKGDYIISLHNALVSKNDFADTVFYSSRANGDTIVEIPTDINSGVIYVELILKGKVVIKSIDYVTTLSPRREISLSVGICTFKREDFVLRNMKHLHDKILVNKDSVLNNHLDIYISDNGHTLDKNLLECDNIKVFYNENFGGAGGFTRTIIESQFKSNKKYDYIILMDDDIVLDFQVLEKTYRFLTYILTDYESSMIGGALLAKETPSMQVENGCIFTERGEYIKVNPKLELNNINNIVRNEQISNANYNGWYYCCIPSKIITKNNLPLPIFIHYDDVDYGTRNNYPQIQLGGIAVWHPNTVGKDPLWMTYYNMRNLLILKSRNSKPTSIFLFKELLKAFLYITSYQYDIAKLSIKAINDYLAGPEFFYKTNPLQLHQKISQYKYSFEQLPIGAIVDTSIVGTFHYYAIGILSSILPTVHDCIYVYSDAPMCRSAFAKRIGFINRTSQTVTYQKKVYKEAFLVLVQFIKASINLILNYRKITSKWRKAYNKITTLNYWNKYLKLEE